MKQPKKVQQHFLPWAGWHSTKENLPEVYAQLPEWWRKWKDVIHECVSNHRRVPSVEELTRRYPPPEEDLSDYPPELTLRSLVTWTRSEGRLVDLMAGLRDA